MRIRQMSATAAAAAAALLLLLSGCGGGDADRAAEKGTAEETAKDTGGDRTPEASEGADKPEKPEKPAKPEKSASPTGKKLLALSEPGFSDFTAGGRTGVVEIGRLSVKELSDGLYAVRAEYRNIAEMNLRGAEPSRGIGLTGPDGVRAERVSGGAGGCAEPGPRSLGPGDAVTACTAFRLPDGAAPATVQYRDGDAVRAEWRV